MSPAQHLPPSTVDVLFYASSLVRQGEGHKADGVNGQDHAVVRRTEHGVVLAVADGISRVRDEHGVRVSSHCEVGAWVAAEVAARAAQQVLAGCADPASGDVVRAVAVALTRALGPLWTELGDRAPLGLSSTLLVAVVTPTSARVWASGDGFWGVIVPADAVTTGLQIEDLLDVRLSGAKSFAGGRNEVGFASTATTEARNGAPAVAAQLRPVLAYRGPVLGLHIATDGLRDESQAEPHVRRQPVRSIQTLEAQLQRPTFCDDLAIAWVATRLPAAEEVAYA